MPERLPPRRRDKDDVEDDEPTATATLEIYDEDEYGQAGDEE